MTQTQTTNQNIANTSIPKAIYEYWEDAFRKTSDFERQLHNFSKEELINFIIEVQGKGVFKKIIHP